MAQNPNYIVNGRFWAAGQASARYNPSAPGLVAGAARFNVNLHFNGTGAVQLMQLAADGKTSTVVATLTSSGTTSYSIADSNYRYFLQCQSLSDEIQYDIYATAFADLLAAGDSLDLAKALAAARYAGA